MIEINFSFSNKINNLRVQAESFEAKELVYQFGYVLNLMQSIVTGDCKALDFFDINSLDVSRFQIVDDFLPLKSIFL